MLPHFLAFLAQRQLALAPPLLLLGAGAVAVPLVVLPAAAGGGGVVVASQGGGGTGHLLLRRPSSLTDDGGEGRAGEVQLERLLAPAAVAAGHVRGLAVSVSVVGAGIAAP